jgi:hypothetical protein
VPKFSVSMRRRVTVHDWYDETAIVEIEAKDEAEAEKLAEWEAHAQDLWTKDPGTDNNADRDFGDTEFDYTEEIEDTE